MKWRCVLATSLFLLVMAGCGSAGPGAVNNSAAAPIDTSTTRLTDGGTFRISYTSGLQPIAINQLHTWTLHVATPDGRPVTGATLAVTGGMPGHNHGLPTQPQVTQDKGSGDYLLEGMKFQMPGHWTVTVQVKAAGQQDSATFQLLLP